MPFTSSSSLTSTDANNMVRGVHRNNGTTTLTGALAETDLSSFTMTGGTMTATGMLDIEAAGTITGVAGTKRIRLFFGGTAILDMPAAAGTADWWLHARIYNTASNAQRIVVEWSDHTTVTNFSKDYTTLAIDTAANVIIKLMGTPAGAGDTINQTVFDILVAQIA